ncbi:nuclear transport factor 2 family protein [Herbiconiux sp. L3-i23]|uniref:nuclear transport factor 2 family protein n=1 Tax=Herbiconiux sp. L3-i23 TaxID=2905871 RepID=UPI00205190CA|nr:hypothetical protein [Herbiconiux sp. L3-i23]BDI23116.1 hypothetical protein L3i23_18920 [Herbiconiux sp. L3-i23]
MTTRTPVETVLAQADAYRRQDAALAWELLDESLTFTSPQDDHLDRDGFMAVCFPTADRFSEQEMVRSLEIEPGVVLLEYIARPPDGPAFSNVEISRVREGRIVEIRVYFGGPVAG